MVSVAAPAGYGKTTVLRQWAERDPRRFTWLPPTACATACRPAGEPRVVVIDDAQLAPPDELRRLVDAAGEWRHGRVLALVARTAPGEALGRVRAHGLTFELTSRELAFTHLEAAHMLALAGLRLNENQVAALLRRTEGWPAALYLAALALADAADADAAIASFSGADQNVADYLRHELLADLPEAQQTLLRETSILTRLTGPLCDAVTGRSGTAADLHALARAGLPLAPLDRSGRAYRAHGLLRSLLRAELARRAPALVPVLHRRAAVWHAAAGEQDAALVHAVAGRDAAVASDTLWTIASTALVDGDTARVGEHLSRFPARELAAQPGLALAAALHHLADGRRARAQAWLDAAHGAPARWTGPAALVRACLAHDGIAAMRADAELARERLTPADPAYGFALYLGGVARQLAGERVPARDRLHEALAQAEAGHAQLAWLCHAQLTLLAIDENDWIDARVHADALPARDTRAGEQALLLAAVAVVAAQRGNAAQARHDAAHAGRLLATGTEGSPWLVAETHAWLARTQIRLSDGPTARLHLTRAARFAGLVDGAPVLTGWIHDGWARADAFADSVTGDGPMLTNAELRVLRLLPSHLSFREIAARLHVSPNTVKTQALSVYRKLGVSCRSDAVARGLAAGVIAD